MIATSDLCNDFALALIFLKGSAAEARGSEHKLPSVSLALLSPGGGLAGRGILQISWEQGAILSNRSTAQVEF